MAQLRNISTGVVISFDDALVGNFSPNEWEPTGTRSVAKKAAPAKRPAPAKRAARKGGTAKKAAAKKAASVAATEAVAAATEG